VSQRIIEYHIARLRDKRAEVRLQSIEELLLLEATEAIDALKEVYDNDDDPAVRKAAQRAGRKLFLLHREKPKPDDP
jgi:HEAT repeat protein